MPGTSTQKQNTHEAKVMLCMWCDQNGVIYYELLKLSEIITDEHYRLQLIRLKQVLVEKRPEWENRHAKATCSFDD